ncbi:hypothetical protein [Streptomyces sp. EN23]|uniref:hypothetical protein n=1 Tax=Streptomyces sp. EN23 TaxID=212774 RepID=UPI000AF3BD85|nr:hypothetical protein [Streptomyces sp. EN23]
MQETQAGPVKPWRDRSNTIGYITGGMEAQVDLLRQVLAQLPADSKAVLILHAPGGKTVSVECGDLCVKQLSSAGLVERSGRSAWVPSEYAQRWLENQDPYFLAAKLHGNVKFFGELLASINDGTTHSDLLETARSSYGLNWNSPDQVRRRTGWLRSLGLIELWGQRVVRTSKGNDFLKKTPTSSPEDTMGATQEDQDALKGLQLTLGELAQLEQVDLRKRRALIGYIPRGNASGNRGAGESPLTPTASIRLLVAMMGNGLTVESFGERCSDELGISRNSFTTMMHALRHTGLVEQTAFNFFAPTEIGHQIKRPDSDRLLVAHLHARYLFFGEIINHLDKPSTTSNLVAVAKEQYGFTQASNGEIRVRLSFLQDAGLVERVDWQRFRVTPGGRAFAQALELQSPKTGTTEHSAENEPEISVDAVPSSIIDDLRAYGRDGSESKAFESAVGKAFSFLGFHAEHLGGPGRTDVLATAQLAKQDRYRVIIDAKSSGNEIVAESSVKFDVLRDHKRKHKADYVVVVGPDFAPRLKNWAVDNEVVLLCIEDLVAILERQSLHPIALTEMREIFARVDTFKDDLVEQYQILERRTALMDRIISLSFQEATDEDPIAEGYISVENIIYAIRKEFSPRPSTEEMDEVLSFLANPIVAALEVTKGRYKLVDSPKNISLRLRGLGGTIKTH